MLERWVLCKDPLSRRELLIVLIGTSLCKAPLCLCWRIIIWGRELSWQNMAIKVTLPIVTDCTFPADHTLLLSHFPLPFPPFSPLLPSPSPQFLPAACTCPSPTRGTRCREEKLLQAAHGNRPHAVAVQHCPSLLAISESCQHAVLAQCWEDPEREVGARGAASSTIMAPVRALEPKKVYHMHAGVTFLPSAMFAPP